MVSADMIFAGKILIVDDQPANVQLLELMLQREGYLCVSSTMDPAAVCELHRKTRYDLILLDLHMPGMDGFQVMEDLKKIEKDNYLSVLVITAQPAQKLRALQAGAKDFIGKPFDRLEVLTRIHNMLEVRLLHKEEKIHSWLLQGLVQERTAELRRSEEKLGELRREFTARSNQCVCHAGDEAVTIAATAARDSSVWSV
jgi:DNA-binding response OmpR family regulator